MTEKLRILVADDSRVIRKAFSKILSDVYDLVEAEDGEAAWDLLNEDDEICAVFTDLNMPHLSGYGLLERIRTSDDEEIKALPVILVTAADGDEEKTKNALTAGATDYVLKPFDSVFLKSKAQAHVKPRDKALGDDKLATLDPLTRLANRAYFLERGDQEMSAANRRKSELALLMVSIDNFAKLLAGTENKLVKGLIRKLGTYMSTEVRLEDTVARVDKDQFAILLVEADLPNAKRLAERLCERIGQKTIRHKETTFSVSVSVGVSALPPDIKRTFNMMLMDAERNLKTAQEQGGNCVVPGSKQVEPVQEAVAVTTDDIVTANIPSIDEALAMLSRRESKLTPEQADEAFKHLLPLLDYCDRVLKLGLAEKLTVLKDRYPGEEKE